MLKRVDPFSRHYHSNKNRPVVGAVGVVAGGGVSSGIDEEVEAVVGPEVGVVVVAGGEVVAVGVEVASDEEILK